MTKCQTVRFLREKALLAIVIKLMDGQSGILN